MKKTFFVACCFVLLLLMACDEASKTDKKTIAQKTNATEQTTTPVTIDIQPFSDIPEKYVSYVFKELKKIYPNIELKKPIPLPQPAFYKPRNRYRADSIIKFLRETTPNGHVNIGLTSKDISATKGNITDYGLMGLGYQPGKSCVVSYFRLSKKEDVFIQFFKLSVHELGHTQGLPHCPVKTCFMRDAEGKNHTNEEKEFCPSCKTHLQSKGWQFTD